MIIKITTPPGHGPRLYLAGRRVHHGLVGCVSMVAGAIMVLTDWHDRPWSTRDILAINTPINPFNEGKTRAALAENGGHNGRR